MARDVLLQQKKVAFIFTRFRYHKKRNPKWTIIAVIEAVSEEVFLSPATVGDILKKGNADVPTPKTIAKYANKNQE